MPGLSTILDGSGKPFHVDEEAVHDDVVKLARLIQEEVALRLTQASSGQTWGADTIVGSTHDLTLEERERLVRTARVAYFTHPIGHQIIDAAVSAIIGPGLVIKPYDRDEEAVEALDEFNRKNRMEIRIREFVMRTLRDGDCMTLWLEDGWREDNPPKIRFMDPLRCSAQNPTIEIAAMIKAARGEVKWLIDDYCGVVTDPQDIENVLFYVFASTVEGNADKWYPADKITHCKWSADSDMRLGRTFLEPCLKRIGQYDDWLQNRIILNRLKTAVIMIRRIKNAGAASVDGLVGQALKSMRPGMPNAMKMPAPGTVLTATENIDYEITAPQLDARDVAEDGRQIRLDIATGAGMPEWIVSADTGGQTKASSITSESPWTKKVQGMQDFFGIHISEMYSRVLQYAMDTGRISKRSKKRILSPAAMSEISQWEQVLTQSIGDDRRAARARAELQRLKAQPSSYEDQENDRSTKVQIVWSDIVPRNEKDGAAVATTLSMLELASKSTLAARFGLDYEVERERMADERAPDGELPSQEEADRMMKELSAAMGEDMTEDGEPSLGQGNKGKSTPPSAGGRAARPSRKAPSAGSSSSRARGSDK